MYPIHYSAFHLVASHVPHKREASSGNFASAYACMPQRSRYYYVHVLLVEDYGQTCSMVAKLLTGLGHEVAEIGTVHGAICLLSNFRFGAVVTDVWLPDGNGLRVIEEAMR